MKLKDAHAYTFLEALGGYGIIEPGTIIFKRNDVVFILLQCLGIDCYSVPDADLMNLECRELEQDETFTIRV